MRGRTALAVVVGTLALGACSSGSKAATTASGSSCAKASQGEVTVVAKALAFNTSCILVPATGGELEITFDNQDTGVNHNFHLLGTPGNPQTLVKAGPSSQRLIVALPIGTYKYVCDVHPPMVGELRVG